MARPRRESADYFSHDADASDDEKLLRLQGKYGCAGYAFFFHMLELLCRTEGFRIKRPDDWWYEMYGPRWFIKTSALKDILRDAIELELFREKDGFVFSEGLIKRMEPLKTKRNRGRVDICAPVSAAETPVSVTETIVSDNRNTPKHRKGKERKGKEREEQPRTQKSPKEIAKDFFLEAEKQQALVQILVGEKGVPAPVAEREVQKFVSYWTELNGSGTKMRWEMERTFDVSKRLTTWFSRVRDFAPKQQGKAAAMVDCS